MSQLERYQIECEIGRGAMGVVYRARDTVLDRTIALKELSPAGKIPESQRQELVDRFLREARTAGRLAHPNIVAVYDVFVEEGRYFIAMEYVEGETLGDTLDRGPLTPRAAELVTAQMLDALGYAHRQGVVHRDIKPDNVFVTDGGHVKVADFGIAKIMSAAGTAMTQAGTVMGTPGYMAPEQIRGETVDGRADIFSVGAILYELVVGRSAFEGDSPTSVMYKVIHVDPAPIAGAISDAAPYLDAILSRALAKDPADRYPTAEEMQSDLANHVGPSVGTLEGPRAGAVGVGKGKSNKVVVAVGAVLVVVLLGMLAVALSSGGAGRWGAGGGSGPQSTTSVLVATPANGKTLEAGAPVDISVTLSGGSAASVAILWNGTPIKTFDAPPYDFSYSPSAEGNAEIKAVAKDGSGASFESQPVQVTMVAKSAAPASSDSQRSGTWYCALIFSNESKSDVGSWVQRARDKGIEADLLFSSDWTLLNSGYWVAYSSLTNDQAVAQSRVDELKRAGVFDPGETRVREMGHRR